MSDTIRCIGWKASDFALQGTDGNTYSLAEIRGSKGTLVVFICNHCPYVKASINRIVAEAEALREIDIGTIAIMPNDTEAYPEDSFDNMKTFAARHDHFLRGRKHTSPRRWHSPAFQPSSVAAPSRSDYASRAGGQGGSRARGRPQAPERLAADR